ncbi:hypothetical protein [Falsiroseomonas oryzae]|uniref:hypothetical protein n=1 Tax=Falsiroseomonas oryzae TaxID=2766473 RepID=UPI0022EAFAA9|nr:hypothetical protein [Roseomonas sp. MO-31]
MISFDYVQHSNGLVLGHVQLHCARQLLACKTLSAAKDQSGGLVGTLAAKGITSVKNLSIATKNVIFVIDHVLVKDSVWRAHDECDFLLNGQYYRMTTGYQPRDTKKADWHTWDNYPPVSVAKIALPRSLMAKKPLVQQAQPAPMNQVSLPTGGLGQPAPTGFYALVSPDPPQTVATNHYASMADLAQGQGPKESFYMTA